MMKSLYIAILCLISSILFSLDLTAQYPYLPQNTQKYINGTIGEERGGRNRYHYGLDFAAPDGSNVYCIETGPLRKKDGASFAIGTYGYIHVVRNANTNVANGTIITAGTLIGTVQDGKGHVHLQRAEQNLSNGLNSQQDIPGWESTDFNWINPILALNPFVDNATPRIQDMILYREGGNQNTNLSNTISTFGKYDLIINTEDQRINANGTGNGFGNAPLTIFYRMLDRNGNEIFPYEGLDFSQVPPNASASTIHGNNANFNTPNFEYIVTNNAFETPYNRYLNLRQRLNAAYDQSTDMPLNTRFRDGSQFRLQGQACDADNNCTIESIPDSPLGYFEIDNFQPFITQVKLTSNGLNVLTHNRSQNEGTPTINNGKVKIEGESGSSLNLFPLGNNVLTVETSEPTQNIKVQWKLTGPGVYNALQDMTASSDKLTWTLTLPSNLAINCYDFKFVGTDLSNNT